MRAPWLVLILAEILDPLLLLGETVCHRNDIDLSATGQRSRETSLRRRRELAFPKGSAFVVSQTAGCSHGSSFVTPDFYEGLSLLYGDQKRSVKLVRQVTLSLLKALQFTQPASWNLDFEFDMIWPIPTQEDLRKTLIRRPSKLKRRHRRELYANFELALNSRNFPGRLCILRAICEAETVLSPPGFSIIEDAIRIILRNFEDADDYDCYDVAYQTKNDCEVVYPCPFSLLKLLLYNLYTGET